MDNKLQNLSYKSLMSYGALLFDLFFIGKVKDSSSTLLNQQIKDKTLIFKEASFFNLKARCLRSANMIEPIKFN